MDITITINDYNKTFDGVVYVDSINGNDTNSGLSMDQPVKTFDKVYSSVPNNGIIYIENELQLEVSTRHIINKNLLFIGDRSKITNTSGELLISNAEVYFYNLILQNECILTFIDAISRIINCDCNFYGFNPPNYNIRAGLYITDGVSYVYNSNLLNPPSCKFGSSSNISSKAYLYNCNRNYNITYYTWPGRITCTVYEYDETESPIISTDKSINIFNMAKINSINYNIITT